MKRVCIAIQPIEKKANTAIYVPAKHDLFPIKAYFSSNIATRLQTVEKKYPKDKYLYTTMIDFLQPNHRAYFKTVKRHNMLDGQFDKIDVRYLDNNPDLPGNWNLYMRYCHKSFLKIREKLAEIKWDHWVVNRYNWQRYIGLDEFVKPGMTITELRTIHNVMAKKYFPHSRRLHWDAGHVLCLLAYCLHRKESFFHFREDGEVERFF